MKQSVEEIVAELRARIGVLRKEAAGDDWTARCSEQTAQELESLRYWIEESGDGANDAR
ncbi:MAG: hypothetical protein JNK76_25865 [Planctomycetales bacterium]|nr:hypothetical protein [Planctomycetales bacterium]